MSQIHEKVEIFQCISRVIICDKNESTKYSFNFLPEFNIEDEWINNMSFKTKYHVFHDLRRDHMVKMAVVMILHEKFILWEYCIRENCERRDKEMNIEFSEKLSFEKKKLYNVQEEGKKKNTFFQCMSWLRTVKLLLLIHNVESRSGLSNENKRQEKNIFVNNYQMWNWKNANKDNTCYKISFFSLWSNSNNNFFKSNWHQCKFIGGDAHYWFHTR